MEFEQQVFQLGYKDGAHYGPATGSRFVLAEEHLLGHAKYVTRSKFGVECEELTDAYIKGYNEGAATFNC